MPPRTPQHDPLDVALGKTPAHVAANPKLTKPQAGFFGAVAGERSPINNQSSRIARPFATQTVLGTGEPTVVAPELQLKLAATELGQTPHQRLARTLADDATPGHGKPLPLTPATRKTIETAPKPATGRRARARARATEAAYTGPAGKTVQAPVRTHATVGPYAGLGSTTGIQIAASAPSILAAVTRAHLAGIPFGSLSSGLQDKFDEALTAASLDPTYKFDVPDIRRYSAETKAKVGLPPSATDGDYIRKRYEKFNGHPGYLTDLVGHIPRNALEVASAPVFLANAVGAVGHEGVFNGNWTPAKNLALETVREQKQFGSDLIHHFGRTLRTQPVGVATLGLAATRVAGAGAGMASRTGVLGKGMQDFATETPRMVKPAGYDGAGVAADAVQEIPRGLTSKKLDERVAQAASDWLASHSDFFGARLEKGRARAVKREQSRVTDQRYRENVEPAVQAVSKLPRAIRRAVLFARGQGVTEEQMARHFETLRDEHATLEHDATNENEVAHWRLIQHDLEKSATDWRGVADKTGGVMTPDMQLALHLATRASRAGEEFMRGQKRLNGQPILSDATAIRRAYYTQAKILSKAGNEHATEWLALDRDAQALEKKLQAARQNPERHAKIARRLEQIRGEQQTRQAEAIAGTEGRLARVQRISDQQTAAGQRTPAADAVEKILNRQGFAPRPEARRLGEMQGHADEAFPAGDRIKPSELEAANKHLRLLERKHRAAQSPATKRRLQAKIDEFTPIRDQMAAAPVGPEVRQLRAQAARAGVEQRAFGAAEKAAAPILPKALRADERTHASLTNPVERERARLERELSGRLNREIPPEEYHTAQTRRLEERLAERDPDAIEAELRIQEQRVAEAFAKYRNAYRTETRGPGHAVEPNAPLDENDPLYFPHTRSSSNRISRRIVGGQGGGKVNLDVVPNYGKRLGKKGAPFGAHLLDTGGVETSPAAFFGAAAKPARIASALEHLRTQMKQFSVKTYEGMGYDARRWVRLDITKDGGESPLTAGARTSEPLDRHLEEMQGSGAMHQMMERFYDPAGRVEKHTATALHDTIPRDGREYVLISRPAYEALQNDFLHGGIYDNAVMRRLQKGTQMWRWATLLARPAWLASNIAGNTIQAATGGAGPVSFARALREDYKKVTPDRAQNTGLFRNDVLRPASAGPAATVLGKFGDMVANANVAFENYTRRALYLRHAIPEAKRAAAKAENRRIGAGFLKMNEDLKPHLEKLGVDEQAAPQIVKVVNRWLGDFSRAKNTPILDLVSPFHRWFEFIGKLVTTMPVRTPGRALLLQRMGEMGIQQQNQEFGGFTPNSLVGSIGLGGGLYKSTQALNPYATVFQLLDPEGEDTHDPGHPSFGGLANALNPLAKAIFEGATGKSPALGLSDIKGAKGSAVGPMNWRVALHDVETSVPFATAAQGYDTAGDAINPISPEARVKGSFAQPSITPGQRAIGYFGGSVRKYDPKKNAGSSLLRLNSEEMARAMAAARARQAAAK